MFAHNRRDNSACKPHGWCAPGTLLGVSDLVGGQPGSQVSRSSARVFFAVEAACGLELAESRVRRNVFIKLNARWEETRDESEREGNGAARNERATKTRREKRTTEQEAQLFLLRWLELRGESLHPRMPGNVPRTENVHRRC